MIEKKNVPVTQYECIGFIFFCDQMMEYLVEEVMKGASDPQQMKEILQEKANEYADNTAEFMQTDSGIGNTEEAQRGIRDGLKKGTQHFRSELSWFT